MSYPQHPHPQPQYNPRAGPSSSAQPRHNPPHSPASLSGAAPKFDIIQWYPQYQSCLQYFLEVAQYSYPCRALAAFINIRLPHQHTSAPPLAISYAANPVGPPPPAAHWGWVSLHPYLRRIVVTGFDAESILYGWFGENWNAGIGPLHEQERRNYMFAAKSGGWAKVKRDYDNVQDEAVPYLKPLGEVEDAEIEAGEQTWSKWLLMEDWMLGTRAPEAEEEGEGDHMSH